MNLDLVQFLVQHLESTLDNQENIIDQWVVYIRFQYESIRLFSFFTRNKFIRGLEKFFSL